MIVSFYDKNFIGLQNNASLVVEKKSYSLTKRPVAMNSLRCKCEPFTEDIQPTFLVIQDNKGGYVYGCLAGIPLLNKDNQTEINGTDLKSVLSSDIYINTTNEDFTTVNAYLNYLFNSWKTQVNQNSFNVELIMPQDRSVSPPIEEIITISDLKPTKEKQIVNVYDEMAKYLRFYKLYMDSRIDLVNKKVIFNLGKTMVKNKNVRLFDYGIKNYGKWIANVNETQGYYKVMNQGTDIWVEGTKWILTSHNQITTNTALRDIYPIKRKVNVSEESMLKANEEALTTLLNSLYNEDIELNADELLQDSSFETNFKIFLKRGQEDPYKELPCGELIYDATGLIKIKIGYRYENIEFIK